MGKSGLQISAIGPVGSDGVHIPGGNLDAIQWATEDVNRIHKDKTIALHMAADAMQCRAAEAMYGVKVKRFSKDEIAKRALANVDGPDTKDSGAYLYESWEEQCEQRSIDPEKYMQVRASVLQARGLQQRGLDGGTDTALVGIDYSHQWFRDLRLAGKLLPKFSRQMDIAAGYATYNGPVVGDGLWMKQSALTSNAFTVNTAFNPTSTIVNLVPQKAMCVIFLSGELTEDSLAPVMENIKTSVLRGANVMLEHVLINGDSLTSTANINSYAVTALGSLDARLMMDGLRALDYKSTLRKSASTFSGVDGGGGIVTLDAITGGLSAMGKYADDPSKVLTIINKRGEFQALKDVKARPDTYSALIDATTGRLNAVSGSQICSVGNSLIDNTSSSQIPTYSTFLSEGYPDNLAASGLYSGSGAFSGFVQVREDNILWGWKRQFDFKVVQLPLGDQVAIAATMRFCFVPIIVGEGVVASRNFAA